MAKKDKEKEIPDFENPKYYINRELSWIGFNKRVLSEAVDNNNPLFERLKFLSISASNLDEFFMVRVASLKDMINAGYLKRDIAGLTAGEQLEKVLDEVHGFVDRQYEIYNEDLLPLLLENGLKICAPSDLDGVDRAYIDRYFDEYVFPVLTPMAVDSSRPFPLIRNKTLNIAALLKKRVTQFLMYHIMQSIFLSIAYFLLTQLCGLVYIILYRIPLINAIPYFINMPIPIVFGLSIVQVITTSVLLYLAITSFMGQYSYFPWVSDVINKNLGR